MILLLACVAPKDVAESPSVDSGSACTAEQVWYPDADGDSYGADGGAAYTGCEAPDGFVLDATDCADEDGNVHPGAVELCNGLDDDCDGTSDVEGVNTYADADGDGYGDPATEGCQPEAGRVDNALDCDDGDPARHPGAEEACDGDDDDCDGRTDAGVIGEWRSDADADGYGSVYESLETCAPPEGWTQIGGDCQPDDPAVHPDAEELCNDSDDDCDGETDEGFDDDADGFLDRACPWGEDCDDSEPDVYPGAPDDVCEDAIDQDCDGLDPICGYASTIDLRDAVELLGEPGDDAGRQLKVADLTGDGTDDLLIATMGADTWSGGGRIYPGGALGSASLEDVALRVRADDGAGRSIGVGDVDGDGAIDLAFGVPNASDNGVVVLLGPFDEERDLADGYTLRGPASTQAGHGSDLGDVNGDGVADAVVGAYNDGGSGGGVYVGYGPITGDRDLEAAYDAHILGDGGLAGRWIRSAADHDGDGVSDLLIAAPYSSLAAPQGGAVYIVLGPPASTIDLATDYDGRFLGAEPNAYAGTGIGSGDIDGDGRDDALVGSYGSAAAEGAAFVLFGPATGEQDSTDADVQIRGSTSASYFGADLVGGDLDGDGNGELVVGQPGNGAGVFLYGGIAPGTYTSTDANVVLSAAHPTDAVGAAVQVGDLDADGWLEVIAGAPSAGAAGAGGVYVTSYTP